MIYLASPFTFKTKGISLKKRKEVEEMRYKRITKIAGLLEEKYPYAFILPITMSFNTAKYMKKLEGEFKYWACRDLTYISRCDEVWVVTMFGWASSIGVQAEIAFAKKRNIPVRYVHPSSLLKTVFPTILV